MNEIVNVGEDRYEVIFVYPLQRFNNLDTKAILEYHKHDVCHCDTVLKSKQRDQVLVCRLITEAKHRQIKSDVIKKD